MGSHQLNGVAPAPQLAGVDPGEATVDYLGRTFGVDSHAIGVALAVEMGRIAGLGEGVEAAGDLDGLTVDGEPGEPPPVLSPTTIDTEET